MRISLIYRYIAREIFSPFWLSLFVFTGILFLARSLNLIYLVIDKNVPVGDILLLFSYILPSFFEIAIPMSLLLAIIVTFGRLSSDSELIVLRATGLSLKALATPVVLFSGVAVIASLILACWVRPWANYRLGLGMFEIARTQASAGLVPGVFNDLGTLTIYAENISEEGEHLGNVIIGDRRDPELQRIILAHHGKIVSDPANRNLGLQLYDGSVQEGTGLDFNVTYFEVNNLSLPYKDLNDEQPSRAGKKSTEMYIGELLSAIRSAASGSTPDAAFSRARFQVELHKRFAIPLSSLCIAFIAMALGIQPSRGSYAGSTATSVSVGVLLIVTYYLLIALASALGEQSLAPPWILLWAPNIIFASLGLFLLEQTASERWMAVSEGVVETIRWCLQKLSLNPAQRYK